MPIDKTTRAIVVGARSQRMMKQVSSLRNTNNGGGAVDKTTRAIVVGARSQRIMKQVSSLHNTNNGGGAVSTLSGREGLGVSKFFVLSS